MISAPGYRTLVTHLFFEGDKFLESDAVFGVAMTLALLITVLAKKSGAVRKEHSQNF